jgi:hypothetical protein
VTIRELKKRGITGEELRRMMWERADISTPIRVPPRWVLIIRGMFT